MAPVATDRHYSMGRTAFEPKGFEAGSGALLHDATGLVWSPILQHDCLFGPDIFLDKMLNLVRNPNINSTWLFRADISLDEQITPPGEEQIKRLQDSTRYRAMRHFDATRVLVRTLVPRNSTRDSPLDETCAFYEGTLPSGLRGTLVVHFPHISSVDDIPFYYPKANAIGLLHAWDPLAKAGTISVHYSLFGGSVVSERLNRTARVLLSNIHKHGEGALEGYVKKFQHDTLVGQVDLQNTYAKLKQKHARSLVESWAESTDPQKHVFEDLCIAAFLIELWADMYKDRPFPGFVDIGCGNGLLVRILDREGYHGWGFDARARKSWQNYNRVLENGLPLLQEHILLPSIVSSGADDDISLGGDGMAATCSIHNGEFPEGTFIISNHADELTPWTPILAALSGSPFLAIPCCSHALSGARFRAAPPRGDKAKPGSSSSTYASLVAWVEAIATACGWTVERETLRIPSTRNIGLVGGRNMPAARISRDAAASIVRDFGGAAGYAENAVKLLKQNTRSH